MPFADHETRGAGQCWTDLPETDDEGGVRASLGRPLVRVRLELRVPIHGHCPARTATCINKH
jgi:hypothetical protein